MAEYHVGCGMFEIYAGTLNKEKTRWKSKTKCTDEAIEAVRDYMVRKLLGGFDIKTAVESGYAWELEGGQTVELHIVFKPNMKDGCCDKDAEVDYE